MVRSGQEKIVSQYITTTKALNDSHAAQHAAVLNQAANFTRLHAAKNFMLHPSQPA